MKRSKLEMYLGYPVIIELLYFNGCEYEGVLHKTGEEIYEDNPNLYIPHNYYFITTNDSRECISCLFRCSHVKSIQLQRGDDE